MPSSPQAVIARFEQLAEQGARVPLQGRDEHQRWAESQAFYAWSSSALNLLHGVFGRDSPHYERLLAEVERIQNNYVNEDHLKSCLGVFLGAKSDADGGFVFRVQATLYGEVFGDIVTAAKAALGEGRHTVASVLACAALEDALKRFASLHGLDTEQKTMEDVVNALKSKGLVGGAQKGLLAAMPKIRNFAMHAEWDKLTPQDAGSVIGFVEQFLLTHFA
jgi:hypothetical protein